MYLFTRSSTSHSMDNFEEMNEPPSLPHGGKSRLSSHSDDSGCDLMDDSLTDMQWLPGMDAGEETGDKHVHLRLVNLELVEELVRAKANLIPFPAFPLLGYLLYCINIGNRKLHIMHIPSEGADFPALSRASLKKRSKSCRPEKQDHKKKDGCRKKLDYSTKKLPNKPPLSYAALIALAICSTPQRMMTLSSIYRWIEATFPFYCTPEAKAWKVRVTGDRCHSSPSKAGMKGGRIRGKKYDPSKSQEKTGSTLLEPSFGGNSVIMTQPT